MNVVQYKVTPSKIIPKRRMPDMRNSLKILAAAAILSFPSISMASPWIIDTDHSNVGFKVRHMMVSNVKGDFARFSGNVDIDDKDPAKLKVDAVIETASINTGVAKRDEHLKSPDFFDVAKYPTMTFVSRKVKKEGLDKFKIYGQLTLHGVTKDVVLDVQGLNNSFKDPWGTIKKGASATTTINRKDYGLAWNKAIESGGVMVGDEVNISLEIELLKK
jgi:polyisoprenoid-binding protein YceI